MMFMLSAQYDKIYMGIDYGETSYGRVFIGQKDTDSQLAALHLVQSDEDQAYIRFSGASVFTGKTAEDEYIMVNVGGNVRFLRLYS